MLANLLVLDTDLRKNVREAGLIEASHIGSNVTESAYLSTDI